METDIEKAGGEIIICQWDNEHNNQVCLDEEDIAEIIRAKFDFDKFDFDDFLDCIIPWAKKNGYDDDDDLSILRV